MPPPRPAIERFARLMEARHGYHEYAWAELDLDALLTAFETAVASAQGALEYEDDWFKATCAFADAGALAARIVDALTPAMHKGGGS